MSKIKWLTNVKLEVGNVELSDGSIGTKTDLFHLKIEDGLIADQVLATENLTSEYEQVDMGGKLALPTFREMHNHLDKTYMTLDWKACMPVKNLAERLQSEAQELAELAPSTKQRATKMIETISAYGATHIRTHVNIDPYIGLKNLEGVREALESFGEKITYEIVAFPQHGLLTDKVPALMREAMRNGATIVGGLDPAGIDKSIERSLDEVMSIATEFDADIDIHLHDSGLVGYYTVDKWLDMLEGANYKGRTAMSHSFSLGDVSVQQQEKIAIKLAEQQVSIMSTVPIGRGNTLPPIELLDRYGVPVHFGCDGFYDSWSPYGSGDMLEKATRYSELYGKIDEQSLRNSLKFITGGITPLDKAGNKVWPNNSDPASFVFFNAASSAEVIARKPKERIVMVKGELLPSGS